MSPRPSIAVARREVLPSTAGTSVIEWASFWGGGATGWKRAATICSRFIVTAQLPVPAQAPPHPSNWEPAVAAGVRVTPTPSSNEAEQVVPQSIPFGWEETVPLPVPVRMTVIECWVGGIAAKVAETWVSPCIATVHPPGPLQAPPQLSKRKPFAGAAVSATEVPWSNDAAQTCPQLMPAGLDWMEPWPFTVMRRPNSRAGRPASIPPCTAPPSVSGGGPASVEELPIEPVPEELTGPQATKRAQSSTKTRIDPPRFFGMSTPPPGLERPVAPLSDDVSSRVQPWVQVGAPPE